MVVPHVAIDLCQPLERRVRLAGDVGAARGASIKSGQPGPQPPQASKEVMATRPRPVEVRLKRAEKRLEIEFDDGQRFSYPAEYLRVESPSAEVMGHGPGQKVIIAGRREVGILELETVGHYAIRIKFDDLH